MNVIIEERIIVSEPKKPSEKRGESAMESFGGVVPPGRYGLLMDDL